jgi:hypothetical protein
LEPTPTPPPLPANIVMIMAISFFTHLVYLLFLWQVETLLLVTVPISTTTKVVVFLICLHFLFPCFMLRSLDIQQITGSGTGRKGITHIDKAAKVIFAELVRNTLFFITKCF